MTKNNIANTKNWSAPSRYIKTSHGIIKKHYNFLSFSKTYHLWEKRSPTIL